MAVPKSVDVKPEKTARKIKRTQRGSRNKKKNAKKIDISEIDDHLESVRHDERTGGALDKKSDEALFVIDAKPASDSKPLTTVSRKERARAKIMYVDTALEANPHVKPLRTKLPSTHNKLIQQGDIVSYKPPIPYKPPIKRKRKRTVEDRETDKTNPVPFDVSTDVNPDVDFGPQSMPTLERKLWERPTAPPTEVDLNPWLEPEKKRREKVKCRSKVIGKAEQSTIPAVEVAPAGTSYNPTFEGHQKLLGTVLAKEMNAIKNLEELSAKVPKRQTAEEKAEALYNELSIGMTGDSEDESDDDDTEDTTADAPVVAKPVIRAENRKTRAQKNKAARQKAKMEEIRKAKAKRKAEAEILRVKSLKKEIALKETELEKRARLKEEKRIAALAKPRLLGKRKFKESKPIYKLTDELAGNLRSSKPEGNPLQDRFNSMQKRNLLETRIRVKKRRRYQLKNYTKRSYKNYELQQELEAKEKAKLQAKGTKA